jgi:hypothetical protein
MALPVLTCQVVPVVGLRFCGPKEIAHESTGTCVIGLVAVSFETF